MDALGRSLAVLVAVAAIICVVPLASDSYDGAGQADGLLLYEVNPFDNEGVSVYNYGSTTVDLRDYIISDNPTLAKEGYIQFTESILVEPGSFVVTPPAAATSTASSTGREPRSTTSAPTG